MQSVDVAIVGGGMVGLAVAAAYRVAAYALPYWSSAYRNLWRRMHHHNCAFRLSMPPAKNYSPVLASGRTFSLVGPVVITVWKCGTKTVLVTFRLTIKAWAIAILGISLKTQ